mmetsp:Transcript_50233/g.109877  ORF Transcript_50233/g.109877 Transcript_50233/m.109877 type:complete len:213 (+) Transcript_50233:444-1082(+)
MQDITVSPVLCALGSQLHRIVCFADDMSEVGIVLSADLLPHILGRLQNHNREIHSADQVFHCCWQSGRGRRRRSSHSHWGRRHLSQRHRRHRWRHHDCGVRVQPSRQRRWSQAGPRGGESRRRQPSRRRWGIHVQRALFRSDNIRILRSVFGCCLSCSCTPGFLISCVRDLPIHNDATQSVQRLHLSSIFILISCDRREIRGQQRLHRQIRH